ncbi:MAG TPA: antitoxin family protein [Blastocatellia bacterium]|nr:antitoxin family protein [Blastocatellia bacterium]
MSQQIEAIYENGIFRPLSPVDLPEGTRVHIEAGISSDAAEPVREQLIADGASPAEAEKILDNFRLLWEQL